MKRMMLVLILLWPVTGVGQVEAYMSGSELMKYCDGTFPNDPNYNPSKFNQCSGYLAGISDATLQLQMWEKIPKRFCKPNSVSTKQLNAVFLKFMHRHPDKWHFSAPSLVLNAYQDAWPCKE